MKIPLIRGTLRGLMHCKNCGREIKKGGYCSNKCQQEFQFKNYIRDWKLGLRSGTRGKMQIASPIRRYLFERFFERAYPSQSKGAQVNCPEIATYDP